MNKIALKNFATNARKELIEKVKAMAFRIGITEESIKKAQFEGSDAIYIDGKQLTKIEKKQREKLISRIKEIGYMQVVEEVAYTWFNRFTALRFMEVNNYLPSKVRVLSSNNPNSSEPDILKEALTVDLGVDKELVYELKLNNKTEELFKYLVIKQCNSLNKILPFMFETIDDYKEILYPEGLLVKKSFLREMTDLSSIPESDWQQVEVIGWLYQFYISEKKDQVFADLKKNIKITKENIPSATQLFTPNWIVRYMVENSLGRIWYESYPNSLLKSDWKYYIDEAEQEEIIINKLEEIRFKNVNPEEITFLDPCCGSGHILVYAFDVFYTMYLEKGYIDQEIPKLILEKNLFGFDIDDRAIQLASFAVMMKAREKSRSVFGQGIELNICAIQESNWMSDEVLDVLIDKSAPPIDQIKQRVVIEYLRNAYWDAKEYGSILNINSLEIDFIFKRMDELVYESGDIFKTILNLEIAEKLPSLLMQTKVMGNKYDVVCTNPPYMGSSGMGEKLNEYVKANYPDSKSDLFAIFIEKCGNLTKINGFQSMITQQAFMFLSSYEKLREKLILKDTVNMVHLGARAFEDIAGEVVQTTAFVIKNSNIKNYTSTFVRLVGYENAQLKERNFLRKENRYLSKKEDLHQIPGMPIAYWVSDTVRQNFQQNSSLYSITTSSSQNVTGNNTKFVRFHWEVEDAKIGVGNRWVFYAKGGGFRKWYGNLVDVVDWSFEAREVYRKGHASQIIPEEYWYKMGITWGLISSSLPSFRLLPEGSTFDKGGSSIFIDNMENYFYVIGFLNSKVSLELLKCLNITLNFQVKDIRNLPIKIESLTYVNTLVEEILKVSKKDWDSFEISRDFINHPILTYKENLTRIEDAYINWSKYADDQFYTLKKNEEELNSVFIEVYDMKYEMTPEITDQDVTIRRAVEERDISSFISFAIGCMLGRYSLDHEGLVYAGGKFDQEEYKTFTANRDNILPILSDAYFEGDMVSRFLEFIKITFGEENLAVNLEFIADSLGKRDGETDKERIRRYFLTDLYKNHVQIYKKRPIYWLFTSGKQKAFNCLIYMHRYDKSTLSRIRTDYLHELQTRMDAEKKSLLVIINGDGLTKEISNAGKELKSLDLKIEELRAYDELLHHMADMQIEIDLDDGVAVNYAKFEGLLAPIK